MKKIIVDAGHGGTDPGAVGHGLQEKDVTLGVALRVASILDDRGYAPVLTRSDDSFVDLNARWRAGKGSDAFIAIHCNAFNQSAHGQEVWWDDHDPTSKEFATCLNKRMVETFPAIYDRGLKEGSASTYTDWYSFRNDAPADVLLELGFIDNASDAQFLTEAYWGTWAACIADAVDQFCGEEWPIPPAKPSSEYDRMIAYEGQVQMLFDGILPYKAQLPVDAQKAIRRVEVEFVHIRGHISAEEKDRLIADERL